MKKEFYDYHQATMYLSDCVIRKGKNPINIKEIKPIDHERGDKFKIFYSVLGDPDIYTCFWPDDSINLNPVPLGLVNMDGVKDAYLVCRKPTRKWKIGLSRYNVVVITLIGNIYGVREFNDLLNDRGMGKTIMNIFPKLLEASDIAKKNKGSCAYSRRFAVDYRDRIFFKSLGEVGILTRRTVLSKDFSYLNEVFKEDADR